VCALDWLLRLSNPSANARLSRLAVDSMPAGRQHFCAVPFLFTSPSLSFTVPHYGRDRRAALTFRRQSQNAKEMMRMQGK